MNNKVIYKHLKKGTDEVFYIGMGTPTRPYIRNGRSNWWDKVVAKYGYDIEIIEDSLSDEEAKCLEIKLIAKYGRRDLGTGTLVNMTDGGDGNNGKVHTDETKEKMSNAQLGDKHWNYGGKITNNHKNKLSIANKGKTLTEEHKMSISESKSKLVINLETGIFYDSINEAAITHNIKPQLLRSWFSRGTNKTKLKLI